MGHIKDRDACSACYGSLIHALARLDEQGLLTRLGTRVYVGQGYREWIAWVLGWGLVLEVLK